jgi:hypothetical protein
MVLNATFNNISVISWRSVLLAEEIGENHRLVAIHWQTWSHNAISSTPRHRRGYYDKQECASKSQLQCYWTCFFCLEKTYWRYKNRSCLIVQHVLYWLRSGVARQCKHYLFLVYKGAYKGGGNNSIIYWCTYNEKTNR